MKKNNLGVFEKEYQVWERYPNGGVEGDYCTIAGVTYIWSVPKNNWIREIPVECSHQTHDIDGDVIIRDNLTVAGILKAYGYSTPSKGLFETPEALKAKYPDEKCEKGDWALVFTEEPKTFAIWRWECSGWYNTGRTTNIDIDVDAFIGREEYSKHIAAFNAHIEDFNASVEKFDNLVKEGFVYGGAVAPDSPAPAPTRNTFYLATKKGVYTNFGNKEITYNGLYVLKATVGGDSIIWGEPEKLFLVDDKGTDSDTSLMSQKGIHDLIDNISIEDVVEVSPSQISQEPYVGENGVLVFNRNTKMFIVEDTTTETYFATSDKFPMAGTSPIKGRFYVTRNANKVYVGIHDSLVRVGDPLSDIGNDKELPMTQEAVTRLISNKGSEIDQIITDAATIDIRVEPSLILEGDTTRVVFDISVEGLYDPYSIENQASLDLKRSDGTEIAYEQDIILEAEDTISDDTEYVLTLSYRDKTREERFLVSAVKPFFVGAGKNYSEVYNMSQYKQGASLSPEGTYAFTPKENDYIFVIIPSYMYMDEATISGIEVPFEAVDSDTIVGYSIYRSSNTYSSELLTIKIN